MNASVVTVQNVDVSSFRQYSACNYIKQAEISSYKTKYKVNRFMIDLYVCMR